MRRSTTDKSARPRSQSKSLITGAPLGLDAEIVQLVEGDNIATYVASGDARCRPHAARAFGCRVLHSSGKITTWVSRTTAAKLLDDVASNGRLAFTVTHIPTLRSLQMKAVDAVIVEMDPADHPHIAAHIEGFVRTTVSVGYPEAVMRSTIRNRIEEMAAIRFTPTAVFTQTPGADAGAVLANAFRAAAS